MTKDTFGRNSSSIPDLDGFGGGNAAYMLLET